MYAYTYNNNTMYYMSRLIEKYHTDREYVK